MVMKRTITLVIAYVYVLLAQAQSSLVAKDGVLDARGHDFTHASLSLNGEWEFFNNQLVDPFQTTEKAVFAEFPYHWNESKSQGFGTFRIKVVVDKNLSTMSLDIPQLYSAYTLWVNETLIANNGIVGTDRKSTEPQWLPQVVSFKAGVDTLTITLQIANFYHSIGGAKNPIYLGLPEKLATTQQTAHLVNTILLSVLTFLGIFFLSIYVFAKREKSALYFALLCLTWALRSVFSEQYLAIHWMPWFDWELGVKIEYLTLYLTMAWAISFIAHLYPMDTNDLVKRILFYPNFLFVFVTLATPALLYTRFLDVYLILAGALILYAVVVILRAMLFERYGAWFSVMGVISLVAAFAYNYLSYQGIFEFSPLTFYTSYLVFFFFLSIALAYQLSPKAGERNYSESLSLEDVMAKK